MKGTLKEGALEIVGALRADGKRALLAGGCVRDLVLGVEPKDYDIATDATPEEVGRVFEKTIPVGVEFGIVAVILEQGQYEVARFRTEGPYRDGRHPESVTFAEPQEDARRRDFTINGMFYDVEEERVVDFVGGKEDLEAGVVRAIGDPVERFREDFLRMLRAVRFAARLGFEIEPATYRAIKATASRIGETSAERIRDELTLILTEGGASRGMALLMETGLLAELMPEVADMDGVAQSPEHHPEGDVWTHVKMMLDELEAGESETLAWGVLLHDIGKPPTYTEADRIRFNGHDALGAKMASALCRRLHMSNDEIERISNLTAHHMRFRHVKEMRLSKLKRFPRQPNFRELLELHRIDCVCSHGGLDLHEFCVQQLEEAGEEDLRPERLLSGDDLIAMGFEPGPRFKEILNRVEDEQLEGRVATREEAVALVEREFGASG